MLNLKKLLTKLCEKVGVIGTVYRAPWTATTASGTQWLTDGITLPSAGTYIIVIHVPNCTSQFILGLAGGFHTLSGLASGTTIYRTSTDGIVIRARLEQSTSVTFSYIDRGWLEAIRIA